MRSPLPTWLQATLFLALPMGLVLAFWRWY